MGKIIEYGPVDEVLRDPKEELTKQYVKGFIT
jgi:phosphate transport system ATP-binding protein